MICRVTAAAAVALSVVLGVAAPAFAHVEINPDEAPRGHDAVVAFIVPNEEQDAATVKVLVKFPTANPIASARVTPMPGWTGVVKTTKLATPIKTDDGDVTQGVESVTWTATGPGLRGREFGEFKLSVVIPDQGDVLDFPTVQTYSNGSVTNWVDQTPPGGPEPESPMPTLKLTAAEGSGTATADGASVTVQKTASQDDADTAKTIGILGIVVGALALLLAIVLAIALVRQGRRSGTST